jgi:hypothetical protein
VLCNAGWITVSGEGNVRRRRTVWLAGLLVLLVAAPATAMTPFARRSMAAARADAARELLSAVLPHRARRVRLDPSVNRALAPQAVACLKRYVVEDHAFWRMAGDPAAVWQWMREHPPRNVRSIGDSTLMQGGTTLAWYIWFSLPNQSNVTSRMLSIGLRPATGGGTAIRVDAIAVAEPRPHQAPCVSAGG